MDYGALARSYQTLFYANDLKKLLNAVCRDDSFADMSKKELHGKVNELLFSNYGGEWVIKYHLAANFLRKDFTAAFEVKAKRSRVDFLAVNGFTHAFEVKSSLDNLSRIGKQTNDYKDVFEFNTVVADGTHFEKIRGAVPDYYGIWVVENGKRTIIREASLSPALQPDAQLGVMTRKEKRSAFGSMDAAEITEQQPASAINLKFKEVLKKRYQERWEFVQMNWNHILPVDLQFFFNTNIDPRLIYQD